MGRETASVLVNGWDNDRVREKGRLERKSKRNERKKTKIEG